MRAPISVIIPVFRSSGTLGRAMTSVLGQSLKPDEIILIDDCSNDGGSTILECKIWVEKAMRFGIHSKLIMLEKNVGPATARNRGLAAVRNEYVAFLDSDDTWVERKLEIQYNYFIKYNDVEVLCHKFGYLKDSPGICLKTEVLMLEKLLFKNKIITSSVMARFSPDLVFPDGKRYSEDYELWLRLAARGHKFVLLNQNLGIRYKYSFGENGLSAQLSEMQNGEIDTFSEIRKLGAISTINYYAAVMFSYIKYFRRILIVISRKANISRSFLIKNKQSL